MPGTVCARVLQEFCLQSKDEEYRLVVFVRVPCVHEADVVPGEVTHHDIVTVVFGIYLDPRIRV